MNCLIRKVCLYSVRGLIQTWIIRGHSSDEIHLRMISIPAFLENGQVLSFGIILLKCKFYPFELFLILNSISIFRELFASSGACAATKRGMESLLGRPGGIIRNLIFFVYGLKGYLAVQKPNPSNFKVYTKYYWSLFQILIFVSLVIVCTEHLQIKAWVDSKNILEHEQKLRIQLGKVSHILMVFGVNLT